MSRTYVVTGSASGVGASTAALLRDRGDRVVGVDLRDAEVEADLSTPDGRARAVDRATTLTDGGGGAGEPDTEVAARNAKWYRDMWLSNDDHERLMVAALTADASKWPAPAIVVSGMSNNTGMPWDLEDGRAWIGYDPQDDVWADLRKAGKA